MVDFLLTKGQLVMKIKPLLLIIILLTFALPLEAKPPKRAFTKVVETALLSVYLGSDYRARRHPDKLSFLHFDIKAKEYLGDIIFTVELVLPDKLYPQKPAYKLEYNGYSLLAENYITEHSRSKISLEFPAIKQDDELMFSIGVHRLKLGQKLKSELHIGLVLQTDQGEIIRIYK